MPPARSAVRGPFGELARGDAFFPLPAAELVLDDLDTVQPVLDAVADRDDPRFVPLPGGADDAARRGIEAVARTGARQRIPAVRVPRVVEHLHLRGTLVDPFVSLLGAVEDAAVTAGADLPLERELEVAVLRLRDDVAARTDTCERAVPDGPAFGELGAVIPAPAVERPAVEKQDPARPALGVRQRVRLRAVCGETRRPPDEQESERQRRRSFRIGCRTHRGTPWNRVTREPRPYRAAGPVAKLRADRRREPGRRCPMTDPASSADQP